MKYDKSEIIKYIQIAQKKHKEGKLNQANKIYKKLINEKIYNYDLLISYGIFNRDIKNLKIAKNLFNFAIKSYPSIIQTYILLAEIYRNENKFNDGLKTLYAAKKIEKFNSEIDYNLSIIYKTIKSFKEAIIFIDLAIKQRPKNQIYKILKADILTESFNNEAAKELLINLKIQKNSFLYFQKEVLISKIFINQKEFTKAENVLLKLKKLFSNEKVLYLNLSDI